MSRSQSEISLFAKDRSEVMLTVNDERCKVSSKQMGRFGYCYFYDVVKVMILQRLRVTD